MDGSMNMETSLDERLKVINCKPEDVKRCVRGGGCGAGRGTKGCTSSPEQSVLK